MSTSRCCPSDDGGSHYHCPRCGEPTGMQGHGSAGRCRPEEKRPAWWANHVVKRERTVTIEAHCEDCAWTWSATSPLNKEANEVVFDALPPASACPECGRPRVAIAITFAPPLVVPAESSCRVQFVFRGAG